MVDMAWPPGTLSGVIVTNRGHTTGDVVASSSASAEGVPRALGGLILDTVECLGAGILRVDVAAHLAALWERASEHKASGEGALECAIASPEGDTLTASARVTAIARGGMWPLCIDTDHWRLFLNPWDGTKTRIALNSEFLQSRSKAEVVAELLRIRAYLWDSGGWRLQRLDVACDFVGTHPREFAQLAACVRQSASATLYFPEGERAELDHDAAVSVKRDDVTGVTLGARTSGCSVVIYDKTRQAADKKAPWILQDLRARGWDGAAVVTRVEARFKARILDEFTALNLRPIESLMRFDDWGPALWSYATSRNVRFCTPSADTNRARWKTREDWAAIGAVGSVAPDRIRWVSAAVREQRQQRAARRFLGGALDLLAEDAATMEFAMVDARNRIMDGAEPSKAFVEALFERFGADLLERLAFGQLEPIDRGTEMISRMRRRLARIEWQDEHARAPDWRDEGGNDDVFRDDSYREAEPGRQS